MIQHFGKAFGKKMHVVRWLHQLVKKCRLMCPR